MQRIKLKSEYEGAIITRVKAGFGYITFDSTRVPQEKYVNFLDVMPDIFEIEPQQPEQLSIEVPKSGTKPKKKKK